MIDYIRSPLVFVWGVLVSITVMAWGISQAQAAGMGLNPVVSSIVIVIAGIKAQLVIMYFMEVRHAPNWLKIAAYGWVFLISVVLLTLYFLS